MNTQGKDHEAAILVYHLVSAPIGNIPLLCFACEASACMHPTERDIL